MMASSENTVQLLKIACAIGCGLVGGVLFAFSSFVISALHRLPPAQGITAMQSINITVITPSFMTAFMGTGLLCLILGIGAIVRWGARDSWFILGAALLYLIGTFLVTMVCNVPMNDALAGVDPGSAHGSQLWTEYLSNWTMWNHVRTACALGASTVLTIGLSLPKLPS